MRYLEFTIYMLQFFQKKKKFEKFKFNYNNLLIRN